MGRLGLAPAFLGRLSRDSFGARLRASLDRDGVTLAVPQLTGAPTTLAIADVDPERVGPVPNFYLAGHLHPAPWTPALSAALPGGVTALHAGSLALVAEPIATSIERLIVSDVPADALVMIDPNYRPDAVTSRAAYLATAVPNPAPRRLVKVSVEDLAYLAPGVPAWTAAVDLLGRGPALVLVTAGASAARALLPGQEVTVDVPPVRVADTIGAGDAFGGAFLGWWLASGLTRSDLHRRGPVREALQAAAEVASLTCTRPGAEPPRG